MRKPELWESKWKRFLCEGMIDVTVDIDELSSVFGYFHLSLQKLSNDDFFTFTPRIPRYPFSDFTGTIIEDDFTKRISVAPTIDQALDALEGQMVPGGWYHLYAGLGTPDAEAKQEDCPETADMQYDMMFRMDKWIEAIITPDPEVNFSDKEQIKGAASPAFFPDEIRDEFEFCVPDADETQEQWLLKPTEMLYVGVLESKTGTLILSNTARHLAEKAGLKLEEY